MKQERVGLGDEVVCKASGLRGIVQSRTEMLYGETQWGIQPQCKKGSDQIPAGNNVDESLIEIVTKKKVEIAPKNGEQKIDVDLGDEVIDDITGYQGTITSITVFASGCKHATLRGKIDKDGKLRESHFCSALRLKKVAAKPKDQPPARQRSGGPTTKLLRREA